VCVSGYYGFGNVGDELILSVLLQAVRGHRVVVLSADPSWTRRQHAVDAVPRDNPARVLAVLRRCDLLVSGGGGLIQDATGVRSVLYYLALIWLARRLGKPVAVWAQGLGPLRTPLGRRAATILDQVQLITVRDEESRQLLEEIGVRRPPIAVTADAVFALPAPRRSAAEELLARSGLALDRRRIALVARRWGGAEAAAHMAELAAALRDGLRAEVVLLPMQRAEDEHFSQAVAQQAGHDVRLFVPALEAEDFAHLLAGFDLVVGMRLHALILAALAGVPFIGLCYDPKISAFMRSVDLEEAAFALPAPVESVVARAVAALAAGGLTPAVQQRVAELRRLAQENITALGRLLAALPR